MTADTSSTADHDAERTAASAAEAAGRLFRAYGRHCVTPDPDTLFATLTAMHSLSDRLRPVGADFHQIEEFVALKALRNFAHHQEEFRSNVRVLPAPAVSDLGVMCLVRRDQVERAIENVDKRWRGSTRAACEAKFHWYGEAVNINPCLFNFMVCAFEMLEELRPRIQRASIADFERSYTYEEEHGLSHLVDGRVSSRAGEVDAFLSMLVGELPEA